MIFMVKKEDDDLRARARDLVLLTHMANLGGIPAEEAAETIYQALRAAVAAERERLLKALASAHDADVITHKQYSYIRAELVGDQPPMSGREPAALRAAVAAERERACGLMRELMEREKKPSERRMAYAIAENTIRRGRTLTATEQLENLAKAFEEWGDPKTAAAIRGDQP